MTNYAIVDHDPDFVVVGEGRTFTCEMIDKAVQMIFDGAKLISTNPDPSCPTAKGKTRPGCGAIAAMFEKATGQEAFSVGKPSPVMMRMARKQIGERSHPSMKAHPSTGPHPIRGSRWSRRKMAFI